MIQVFTFKNIEILNCVGDIHGNVKELIYKIVNQYQLKNSINIVNGDIGFGFESLQYIIELFIKLDLKLLQNNNHIVLYRGNHDDPSYFNGENNKIFEQFSNIHVVPDYSIISINDSFNILCIGGAISVDRTERLQEMNPNFSRHSFKKFKTIYWGDENVIYNENKLDEINNNFVINMVCTHSSPDFCFPYTKDGIKGWLLKDPYLEEDIRIERETLTKIYNHLIKEQPVLLIWSYGHFHKHNVEYKDNIKFLACNCMEFNEIRF